MRRERGPRAVLGVGGVERAEKLALIGVSALISLNVVFYAMLLPLGGMPAWLYAVAFLTAVAGFDLLLVGCFEKLRYLVVAGAFAIWLSLIPDAVYFSLAVFKASTLAKTPLVVASAYAVWKTFKPEIVQYGKAVAVTWLVASIALVAGVFTGLLGMDVAFTLSWIWAITGAIIFAEGVRRGKDFAFISSAIALYALALMVDIQLVKTHPEAFTVSNLVAMVTTMLLLPRVLIEEEKFDLEREKFEWEKEIEKKRIWAPYLPPEIREKKAKEELGIE